MHGWPDANSGNVSSTLATKFLAFVITHGPFKPPENCEDNYNEVPIAVINWRQIMVVLSAFW